MIHDLSVHTNRNLTDIFMRHLFPLFTTPQTEGYQARVKLNRYGDASYLPSGSARPDYLPIYRNGVRQFVEKHFTVNQHISDENYVFWTIEPLQPWLDTDLVESRVQLDPWWWPRGPGRVPVDWGIPESASAEYASLLNGGGKIGGRFDYCGFLGSVRALPGCPILISIRPSNGFMQHSFGTPYKKLPSIPEPECGQKGNRLQPIHFTDMYKFRQNLSSDNPFENMDEYGWQVSVECLADELEYLQAKPEQIIVVAGYVERCFSQGQEGWLHKGGKLRTQWKECEKHSRLDHWLAVVEDALAIRDHQVCFWTTTGFKERIETALKTMPPHDTTQYLRGLL